MGVSVVRVSDDTTHFAGAVRGELVGDSAASRELCVKTLSQNDIAVIQHEYGIYGGADGDDVIDIIRGLKVPSIVVAHTVLKNPSVHQREVLEALVAFADHVVVMSEAANMRLCESYEVDRRKISTVPHGASLATDLSVAASGRPTLLTWGLIGPGKGIERVIDAMAGLQALPCSPKYVVAGQTHPKVLAAQGESYREACREQARRLGIEDAVSFDATYRDVSSLAELAAWASAIVLPYDSTDQVTSGVLVDAVAAGRPVIATRFPHAVELLSDGAGIVVDHDDPDALASALRKVLTDPRTAGRMAARSRSLAPSMSWPMVAHEYLIRVRRVLDSRLALV